MNKMIFYELTDVEGEEPVILSSVIEAISVLILRLPWSHLKEIYIIGTGLIYIWREFILSQMSRSFQKMIRKCPETAQLLMAKIWENCL